MSAATSPAAAATMDICLDGQTQAVPLGSTLAALVAAHGHAPQGVGTALNGRFVARGARGDSVLQPGDDVLFFQPIVGG